MGKNSRVKNVLKGQLTLDNVWAIKADLDEAVATQDYDRIKTIKLIYERLQSNTNYTEDCFLKGPYRRESDRQIDFAKNSNMLLRNIEDHIDKYIHKDDISVKLGKCDCLAGDIWIMREMYDDFMNLDTKDNYFVEQHNMMVGKSIINQLESWLKYDYSKHYFLDPIIKEVKQGYEDKYGNQNPKTTFHAFRKDYCEEGSSVLASYQYGKNVMTKNNTNKSVLGAMTYGAQKEDDKLTK